MYNFLEDIIGLLKDVFLFKFGRLDFSWNEGIVVFFRCKDSVRLGKRWS